jgi:4'-phosphopantetheinyl transferase
MWLIRIPLDRYSFHYPHERGVGIAIEPGLDDEAGRWSFWQCRPMPEYLLAICAERLDMASPRLSFRKLVPSATDELLQLRLLKTSEPYAR